MKARPGRIKTLWHGKTERCSCPECGNGKTDKLTHLKRDLTLCEICKATFDPETGAIWRKDEYKNMEGGL